MNEKQLVVYFSVKSCANFYIWNVLSFYCCFIISAAVSTSTLLSMTKKTLKENTDKYFCCCGRIDISKGAFIFCMLQLIYHIINSIIELGCIDSQFLKILNVSIFNTVFLTAAIILFIDCLSSSYIKAFVRINWFFIFICMVNTISSFGLLIVSLVGLCLDKEKMAIIAQINQYFLYKTVIKSDALYYWLSFFVVKYLIFIGFNIWFLVVLLKERRYIINLKKDEKLLNATIATIFNGSIQGTNTIDDRQRDNSKISKTTSVTEITGITIPTTTESQISGIEVFENEGHDSRDQVIEKKEKIIKHNGRVIKNEQILIINGQIVKEKHVENFYSL